MFRFTAVTRALALTLAILMFVTPLLAQQTQNSISDFMQGKIDGERAAKSTGAGFGWFLLGCVGGVLWAYILEPDVPGAEALMGKSPEYVMGYDEGYKKGAKSARVKMAFYGCIASGVAYCALYFVVIAAAASESDNNNEW